MRRFLASLFFIFLFAYSLSKLQAEELLVRSPRFAGSFYPSNADELGKMIDDFLAKVPEQKISGTLQGLILPHAGYIYSGQVAAYGYRFLQGRHYDSVILIGPSHHTQFRGASVWQKGIWKTPLGEVPIDELLASEIALEDPSLQFSSEAHLPEHSIEVHVPFLQRTLGDFKLVPIVMGEISLQDARILSVAIWKHIQGKNVLVIASTDMSHYHDSGFAETMDQRTLNWIQAADPVKLFAEINAGASELCGASAVLTQLELGKLYSNSGIQILNYSHSGKVTGDNSRVVGYQASALFIAQEEASETAGPLNPEEQKELLKIARQSVETYVNENRVPEFNPRFDRLKKNQAAFVTLHKNGGLRGCIGHLTAVEPLYLSVRDNAVNAAVRDTRFAPVKPDELDQITIEISVLSNPQKIRGADEIVLGQHGVILRQGNRSGVFLPQVAAETGWDKETFLGELCSQKAGLAADCWKHPETEFFVFKTQVFSE